MENVHTPNSKKNIQWLVATAATMLLLIGIPAQAAPEMYFIHNDHLGTPQAVTDQNQQIVWRARQKPFGEATEEVSTIEQKARFQGQYLDEETGFHYNYFRDYDPSIGRYIQSDPIGLGGGVNTYGYALLNPLSFTDPYGLVSWNCVVTNYSAGFFLLGGGSARYRCESDCSNGEYKVKTEVSVEFASVGPSLEVGVVESRNNKFTDENVVPDAHVFNGDYFEAGFNVTYGLGVGLSSTSFGRGTVTGHNGGLTGGLAAAIGAVSGTARVVSEEKVKCNKSCE